MTNLKPIIQWYSSLRPDTLEQIDQFYDEQASFQDPFNDVVGHEAIRNIFDHMFKVTKNPKFTVLDTQLESNTPWLSWCFEFGLFGKARRIEGTSRLDFNVDGQVISHRDYWDGLELLTAIPLVGRIIHHLQRKMSAPTKQASFNNE